MPAAGEIHRLKKRRLPAGFLAGDESVKHNGQFNSSLSRLNLIFSRQPNFLATTLEKQLNPTILPKFKGQIRRFCQLLEPIRFRLQDLMDVYKTWTRVHGPPLWTRSMDHPMDPVHGPPLWTRSMDHPTDHH